MPSARAPSMSSAYESPTITVSARPTPSAARALSKIEACGFVRPWLFEPTATSTSSRWWRGELLEVALAVRDQADPEPVPRAAPRARARVVVEVEVRVVLPAPDDLDGARARAVGVAAHAPDDVLGERDPDLLVVDELGVRPQVLERGEPRRPRSDRGRARARAPPRRCRYASGPELGPGPREREVDVEENGAEHAPSIRHRPASGRRSLTLVAPKKGAGGGTSGSPTPNRGAQIRTGDLSDPNGARYQAAPHPERPQGTRSAAR